MFSKDPSQQEKYMYINTTYVYNKNLVCNILVYICICIYICICVCIYIYVCVCVFGIYMNIGKYKKISSKYDLTECHQLKEKSFKKILCSTGAPWLRTQTTAESYRQFLICYKLHESPNRATGCSSVSAVVLNLRNRAVCRRRQNALNTDGT
jgi:hypothetical protein